MTGSGEDDKHTEASESVPTADRTDTDNVADSTGRETRQDSGRRPDGETPGSQSSEQGTAEEREPTRSAGDGPVRDGRQTDVPPTGTEVPPDGTDSPPETTGHAHEPDSTGRTPASREAQSDHPHGTDRGDDPPLEGSNRPRETETDDSEDWTIVVRDIAVTVLAVLLVGGYLFAISGVWPPMVAIESGSMEPNMEVNDMVFVMDEDRFQPADAHGETGVVTAQRGEETGYGQYGGYGDVIVFKPGGSDRQTPIIHRAMFWVEEGDNWCEMADPELLGVVNTDSARCEANHAGFITKGDANNDYDQEGSGQAGMPVKPEWVVGTAELRIPGLGWFRLQY